MKNIISILLVMVIVLTMTACVANPDTKTAASEATIMATTEPATEPTTKAVSDPLISVNLYGVVYESELKVKPIRTETLKTMTPEEVSNFFAEMVRISETEALSAPDMYQVGYNFYYIWVRNHFDNYPTFDKSEFEAQASKAFTNIYEQALKCQIPLEELHIWADIPVANVLYEYFSSSNFYAPEYVYGYGIWGLEEEDLVRVAEVFFENPLMAANCYFPTQVICCSLYYGFNNSVTDAAWEHLVALSKASSLHYKIVHNHFRYNITSALCYDILSIARLQNGELDLQNIDKISEVAKNILENPQHDIYDKYSILCYAFYHYSSDTYEDDTISNMAFESLFELAENADEETAKQIMDVIEIFDSDVRDELLEILERNS